MTGRQKMGVGAVLLVIVGIGAVTYLSLGDDELSVQEALADTRSVGFDAVIWRASSAMRQQAEEIAQRSGRDVGRISGDGRVILLRGRQITDLLTQPLVIAWFPSSEDAASRVEADRPLFEGHLSEDERAGLPEGFEVRRLTEKLVCNLVVTSYDDGSDRRLSARFARLVGVLQSRCS